MARPRLLSLATIPRLLAGWLLLALPGQAAIAASGCEDLRGGAITPGVSWLLEIKPILVRECRGCHDIGQTPDFSDFPLDALYKLHFADYVVPGQPMQSRLFLQVNCSDPGSLPQMPLGAPVLPRSERELIYDWIAQGAVGDPGMSAPSGFVFPMAFRDGMESIR